MLVLHSWIKDSDMCIQECKLSNIEAVEFVKDYASNIARGVAEFYLDTNSTWRFTELLEHLRLSFEMDKSFSLLVGDFYNWSQHHKETEGQFKDELQVLSRKLFSVCPEWKAEVNEALKTPLAFWLCDSYLATMAHNFLKT